MWTGYKAAYNIVTGEPEPIALDGKKKLYYMSHCCVEERGLHGNGLDAVDSVLRHEATAANVEELERHMVNASNLEFSKKESDMDEWNYDVIRQGEPGLFIFDGGTYSRGPLSIVQLDAYGEKNTGEYSPTEDVSVIESCLQWNGEERVRVSVTLSSELMEVPGKEEPELDVSLLRVAIVRETWEGISGQYCSTTQSESDAQDKIDSGKTRIPRSEMNGFWNVFDIHVSRVEDIDMRTGEPAIIPIYSSQEFQRFFQSGESVLGAEENECVLDGGALWLPHRVILQMSTPVASDDIGLEVSMLWSPSPGKSLTMTRRYSKTGSFIEATCSTGIKISNK